MTAWVSEGVIQAQETASVNALRQEGARYVEKQESSVVRAVGRSGDVLRDLALMGDKSWRALEAILRNLYYLRETLETIRGFEQKNHMV